MPKIYTFWWIKGTIENFVSTSIYLFSFDLDLNLKKWMKKDLIDSEYIGIWDPIDINEWNKFQEINYIWKIKRIWNFEANYNEVPNIFRDSFNIIKGEKEIDEIFINKLSSALINQLNLFHLNEKDSWIKIKRWAFIETNSPIPYDKWNILFKRKVVHSNYFELSDTNGIIFDPFDLDNLKLEISNNIMYFPKNTAYHIVDKNDWYVPWWDTQLKNKFLTLFAESNTNVISKIEILNKLNFWTTQLKDFISNMIRDDYIKHFSIDSKIAKTIFKNVWWWVEFNRIN